MSAQSDSFSLRISTPQEEGTMRTSKWLKHQVLLDINEMESLSEALGPFSIFVVSEVVSSQTMEISLSEFLEKYADYVRTLSLGKKPEEASFRKYFSVIWTTQTDLLYGMKVGEEKYLIKSLRPVIQLQPHHFVRSTVDGKFYPMTQGTGSISWGIQFSYPQIFQKPKEHTYERVSISEEFPNTQLFQKLALWLRRNTLPTSFISEEKRITTPMRIGKQAFSWVDSHPGLIAQNLRVHRYSEESL